MEKELWKGNEAIAEAAIRAGCNCFFGYPITPQSEVPEYMSLHLPRHGGVFVQSESEVAAINMVYGAAGAGMRAMTSSSSPGVSLKQEGITYIAGAELPCVIVNCMRGGPGLGTIQPAQGDYYQATRGGGNGDYRTPVLAPSNIQEAVDFTQEAFDIADQYRTPVMDILISNASGQPIYDQITSQIKNLIVSGVLAPGEALPSIRSLAKDLRISVITTKRAYDELEAEGFLYTVAGKGCFVAEKNVELIREEHLKQIESHLQSAAELAAACNLTSEELLEMFRILLGEEE